MRKIIFKGSLEDLRKILKKIVKEGQSRRIVVKNKNSEIIINIPLNAGLFALMITPFLFGAALTSVCASGCIIEIEKR